MNQVKKANNLVKLILNKRFLVTKSSINTPLSTNIEQEKEILNPFKNNNLQNRKLNLVKPLLKPTQEAVIN